MNSAELFRAKLREPYMRMRRYHDPEVQWLATVGTQLANDLDAITAERDGIRVELHRVLIERDQWRESSELYAPRAVLAATSLETL